MTKPANAGTVEDEKVFQKQALQWLRLNGCEVWRQNQGRKKGYIRFADVDGISDIIGLTNKGRFIAVECKKVGKNPTDDQIDFLRKIKNKGGIAIVAATLKELAEAYGFQTVEIVEGGGA